MPKTLRDLITSNEFEGYHTSNPEWRFDPEQIETAIYGSNGAYNLDYDVVERFVKAFNLEVISINTWTCTDTPVGLEILRMQGVPIGIIWQSARKSDQTISFFDKSGLRSFKAAWESVKENPDEDANFVPDDLLDMPVPEPKEKNLELEGGRNYLPSMTPVGMADWIDRQGGLKAITNKAPLGYIERTLIQNIKDRDNFLEQLREREKELPPERVKLLEGDIKKMTDHRAALDNMREKVRARVLELS
jgi:hypothetical protein